MSIINTTLHIYLNRLLGSCGVCLFILYKGMMFLYLWEYKIQQYYFQNNCSQKEAHM